MTLTRRLVSGDLPTWAGRRTLVVAPGSPLAFVRMEWADTLVVVTAGALEIESRAGTRVVMATGDIVALTTLPVAWLRAHGHEPAVLILVHRAARIPRTGTRITDEFDDVPASHQYTDAHQRRSSA